MYADIDDLFTRLWLHTENQLLDISRFLYEIYVACTAFNTYTSLSELPIWVKDGGNEYPRIQGFISELPCTELYVSINIISEFGHERSS